MDKNIYTPEIPKIRGIFKIEKFRYLKSGRLQMFDWFEFPNLVVNTGGAIMLDLLAGAGGTAFNNANAYIGIGDSLTAAAVGQTDLQAASNKTRKAMDATYPSRSGQIMTYKATFLTSDANYTWNEIAIFNGSSGNTMFNRALVPTPFTKTAGLAIASTYTVQCP